MKVLISAFKPFNNEMINPSLEIANQIINEKLFNDIKLVVLDVLYNKDSLVLLNCIKEYNPDIIHAHDMRASYITALVAKRTPMVCHIHNNAFASRGLSLKSVAFLLAARKAKHIFWVSESAYHGYIFKIFFRKKSSVLPNIIDVDALYDKMQKDTKYGVLPKLK